jgi:hypothetical protein
MSTKLTGRENLTKYASWLGPGRPHKKNPSRDVCIKSTVVGSSALWNGKDPDPYKIVGFGSVSK